MRSCFRWQCHQRSSVSMNIIYWAKPCRLLQQPLRLFHRGVHRSSCTIIDHRPCCFAGWYGCWFELSTFWDILQGLHTGSNIRREDHEKMIVWNCVPSDCLRNHISSYVEIYYPILPFNFYQRHSAATSHNTQHQSTTINKKCTDHGGRLPLERYSM